VAHWNADGNAVDSAGGHNGVLKGTAFYGDGRAGQAFHFDGSPDGFVEVADAPDLRLTQTVSITFWVRRLSLDFPTRPFADVVVEKGGDWTGGQVNYLVSLHNPDYNYCLHFVFANGWRGGGSIADMEWHHCAVVARNGDANPVLYIDGVKQVVQYGEGASTIQLYPSTRPLHIGAELDPATGWFYYSRTLVDELSIFNKALNVGEVQALFHQAPPKRTTRPASSVPSPRIVAGTKASSVKSLVSVSSDLILNYEYPAGNLVLSWPGTAVLQTSSRLDGPFVDVPLAVSPYTNDFTDSPRFFRLRPGQ
jgi:hypothetical protein